MRNEPRGSSATKVNDKLKLVDAEPCQTTKFAPILSWSIYIAYIMLRLNKYITLFLNFLVQNGTFILQPLNIKLTSPKRLFVISSTALFYCFQTSRLVCRCCFFPRNPSITAKVEIYVKTHCSQEPCVSILK